MVGHIPTHPFLEANPNPNLNLTCGPQPYKVLGEGWGGRGVVLVVLLWGVPSLDGRGGSSVADHLSSHPLVEIHFQTIDGFIKSCV